jgi:penicillin-binding protein 1A
MPPSRRPARRPPGRAAGGPTGAKPKVVTTPRRRGWFWRHRKPLYLLGLVAFAGLAGLAYRVVVAPLPNETTLAQTTILTDVHGTTLAELSNGQNRVDVTIDKVPPIVIDAVVATEDRGFFHHGAVDPLGIVRALIADARGRSLQGGSTITQQYVKNAFLTPKRTLSRKLTEVILAVKLERKYSKNQILERYLNTIYWGRGAYGVEAAARAYFGKDVGALGAGEAAYLAGIISSPELADPYRNLRVATARRDRSLDDLVATHHLSEAAASAAKKVPITTLVKENAEAANPTVTNPQDGTEYFVSDVTSELIRRYGEGRALAGGLRVRTTLDLTLQHQAYQSVYGVLNQPGDPSGALVALDPSGAVRAMVGGKGYAVSKVNLAVGANGGGTGRQPGSTFKPILLAELMAEGYSALSKFPAPAEIILPGADNGKDYHVKNFDMEAFPNDISVLDATRDSVNTVYAQVAAAIGPSNLVKRAHLMGVDTPLPANASLVLGTTEVSVLEMATVYATLMDRGVRHDNHVIEEVRTADGTLVDRTASAGKQAVPQDVADEVTYCLQQVVINGTGVGAKIGRPLAGKTGTTESNSDAWFIGYTPQLTAAVWMGYRDSKQPMVDVHGVQNVNGGSLPAEIFRRFMTGAMQGVPVEDFPPVANLKGRTLNGPPVTLVTTTTSSTSTTSTTSTTVPSPTTSTTGAKSTTTTTRGVPVTTVRPAPTPGPGP